MVDNKDIITKRIRSKDYRDIFVWGVYGGDRPDYFEVVIQSYGVNAAESQSEDGKKIVTEVRDEVCLKMSPRVAKIIYEWLGSHIQSYEKAHGEIAQQKELD